MIHSRLIFHSRLNFHIPDIKKTHFPQQAQFPHTGSISTSLTLRRLIFHSKLNFHIQAQFPHPWHYRAGYFSGWLSEKSPGLGKKDSHFCLVYGKVYQKISISILYNVRGNGIFPELNFHITDVDSEPAVLKESPPLFTTNIFFKNPQFRLFLFVTRQNIIEFLKIHVFKVEIIPRFFP